MIVGHPLLAFVLRNVTIDGEILKSKKLDQKGNVIYRTPFNEAEYKGLKITYTDNSNYSIAGSLHKYWNDGKYNYDDFTIEDFQNSINELSNTFGVIPDDCVLRSLEIGVNLVPPIDTNEILDGCYLHKTKPFESKIDRESGRFIQCVHSQYIVKIYNKRLHCYNDGYSLGKEVLRFEIKFTKMEKLNSLGIYTLEDLLEFDFRKFENLLSKEWDNILFFDPTLSIENKNWKKYSNPRYWRDLLKRESNSAFYKHKRNLNRLVEENSENVKMKIAKLIRAKIKFLTKGGTSFDPLTMKSNKIPHQKCNLKLEINSF